VSYYSACLDVVVSELSLRTLRHDASSLYRRSSSAQAAGRR